MKTSPSDYFCYFCNPVPECVYYEFDHFNLMIDPYPLCENHFMLTSKDHFGCSGELSRKALEELIQIRQLLQEVLSGFSDSWIAYEHGRSGTCQKSGPETISCHHMHLHLLPLSVSIHKELEVLFRHRTVEQLIDLREWFHGYGEYLYFEDSHGFARCYLPQGKKVAPHLLRTLIAEKRGRPELSDWQNYWDGVRFEKNCQFRKEITPLLKRCYV